MARQCKQCWERLPVYAETLWIEYCYDCKNKWIEEEPKFDMPPWFEELFWNSFNKPKYS